MCRVCYGPSLSCAELPLNPFSLTQHFLTLSFFIQHFMLLISELLLVTHSNDNHSPEPVMREVPSPYKRSELSNRVFCSFSSRKESICK